jgi:hypothetical protein
MAVLLNIKLDIARRLRYAVNIKIGENELYWHLIRALIATQQPSLSLFAISLSLAFALKSGTTVPLGRRGFLLVVPEIMGQQDDQSREHAA